jgi:arylsulfatase A-like enzyme
MRTLLVLLLLPVSLFGAERPPNIVVILADDLGYGDVKALNPEGKIATPNLDRLAASGMIFTDAHTPSSVCSPTRYGLITGRYCWRTPLQSGVLGGLSPRLIEANRPTIASLLKSKGYTTACIGKWHLGMDFVVKEGKQITRLNIEPREQVNNVDYTQPIKNGPNSVGFDYYYGISASLDMVPYAFIENDKLTANPTEDRDFAMRSDRPQTRTRKGPTAPGFEAVDVLPNCTQTAVKLIERQSEKSEPFFLYLPLTAPHTPILPSKEINGKSGLGPYADFVMQTDVAVGQILKTLEDRKLTEKTLIVFTSDNGCSPQADFPDLVKKGHHPSYRFRGNKADIFEGGHRVPFLVSWPGKVAGKSQSDQLVCLTDVLRTVCEIAEVKVPDTAGEDSFSFLPVLLGKKSEGLRTSIVHHSINGSFAIREGKWKLCLCGDSGGWSSPRPGKVEGRNLPPTQLFDLVEDLSEMKNLESSQPEIVRLTKQLEAIVARGRSTPGPEGSNAVRVEIRKK